MSELLSRSRRCANTNDAAQEGLDSRWILLVDDETLLRRLFAKTLRAGGYQVAEAENGFQALEILTAGAEIRGKRAFDLVISDLILPGLHGVNLIHQIRVEWPEMPILVISGFLSDTPGKVILEGFAEFIQKPVNPAALLAIVQRLFRHQFNRRLQVCIPPQEPQTR